MYSVRIESILESGENIVNRFAGSLNDKKGTWFVTNRRLIHLPSPVVKTGWKKTIIGGILFGGIGGTLGTKVETPESFKDYRLDNLISLEVMEGNTLKAIFQLPGFSDKETVLIEAKWPHDFKSEVEEAKEHLEEEY